VEPTLFVQGKVYLWLDGVLLDASGNEVAAVELRPVDGDHPWSVSWADGTQSAFPSAADAHDHIVTTLAGGSQTPSVA